VLPVEAAVDDRAPASAVVDEEHERRPGEVQQLEVARRCGSERRIDKASA
jgi:hypothetical protein